MNDWHTIVKEHGPLVWQTAYRLLGNEPDAADCFQETFVSALHAARKAAVASWPHFLKRLATMRALDLLRRRIRERQRQRPEIDFEQIVGERAGPGRLLEDQEQVERLRAALATMPVSQSEVFCLRYLSDMTYEEIAAITGMTANGVGVTLHRVKDRLREALGVAPQACEIGGEQ